MNTCNKCIHCKKKTVYSELMKVITDIEYECHREDPYKKVQDIVTGSTSIHVIKKIKYCRDERTHPSSTDYCGQEGKYFVRKNLFNILKKAFSKCK